MAQCGACTVIMGTEVIRSCVKPVGNVGDAPITTLEGLGTPEKPHPIQQAFIDEGAAQCGYCMSGVMLTAKALLDAKPQATDEDIRAALGGCAVPLLRTYPDVARHSPLPGWAVRMIASRREFLKSAGALVVSLGAVSSDFAQQHSQGQFGTHPSHIDPGKLDSWIAVNAEGTVTAYTGKCDLGQGIFTAQTQLIAEELCVPLRAVKLVQCDTAVTPDQGSTSGSQSTPTNFNVEELALAAATAREALVSMAAAHLGVDAVKLTVRDGQIVSADGKRVSYAQLIGAKKFSLPVNKQAKRRSQKEWTVLGKPVPALDHVALMTGTFEFVQNVRVPGMLHGRVVRPPAMGATLVSVDQGSIRDLPGVVKVVVRKDFVGVVAETQWAAVEAARRLVCHWERGPGLPAQETFFEHMRQQPSYDELSVDSGDVGEVLAKATVVHARYTYPYQMHGSLGTSCAVADVTQDGATVWSPTQSVYPTRNCIAMLLNLAADKIRVIFVRGSGCYGLNGADAVSFDAAVLSQEAGRPVRLQYSRQDEMMWENFGNAVGSSRVDLQACKLEYSIVSPK